MFSLDLSEGILQLLEVSYDIYNMLLKHAVGLICVDPSFWEGGSPWQIIEKINPYFVSVGCSLVVLFFVIGFCNSSTDTRNDVRFETILKSLIRVGVAEYFVVNSLTILKAIFGSVAALANLVSGGGLSRGLTVKLSDKMTKAVKKVDFPGNIIPLFISLLVFLGMVICGFVLIYTAYVRIVRCLVIVPYGAIAFSTMAGDSQMIAQVLPSFIKYFISTVLETVTMIIGLMLSSAIVSSNTFQGIFSLTTEVGSVGHVVNLLLSTVMICFVTIGIVKSAQTITQRALGL